MDDYVDGQLQNVNTARRGVEFTPWGQMVAYQILPYHPGDNAL